MAKGSVWLGLHDAARKRRILSHHPGVWASVVVTVDGDVITKNVTN